MTCNAWVKNILVDYVNDIINDVSVHNGIEVMVERHQGDEFHLLREIVRTHQVMMTAFSRAIGMPASRFALLKYLAISQKSVGVMELAAKLEVNPSAVTRLIKEMEDEHFVVRRGDPRDGRRNYLSLTAKGVKLFEQLHLRSHKMERALAAFIDPQDIVTTTRVLEKLQEFMGSISDEHAVPIDNAVKGG